MPGKPLVKMVQGLVLAVVVIALCGSAWAQDGTTPAPGADTGQRGQRQRMTPEEMQKRMAEFRARMEDEVRKNLGFTEEEWKLVKPLYEKVTDLQRQTMSGAFRGMAGNFGRGGTGGTGSTGGRRRPGSDNTQPQPGAEQPARPAPPADTSELGKARTKLRETLDNKDATADQIAAALKDFRTARDNLDKQLADARKALLEVLTVKQEAMLVASGVLR